MLEWLRKRASTEARPKERELEEKRKEQQEIEATRKQQGDQLTGFATANVSNYSATAITSSSLIKSTRTATRGAIFSSM